MSTTEAELTRHSVRRNGFMSLSTPTALRSMCVGLVAGLVGLGIATLDLVVDRHNAADEALTAAEPLLVAAQELYGSLADADAASSTAYLRAGFDPAELFIRYVNDIESAGEQTARLTAMDGLSETSREAAHVIAAQLPVYAGHIEAARANNRLGNPVGAAYQRRASDLMRTTLLPAATSIYEHATTRLNRQYATATSRRGLGLAITLGALLLLALVAVQIFVTRRSRRRLNLGLLLASFLLVALASWLVIALADQQRDAVASQRDGADPVVVLSTMRILALRSFADQNLDVIERGTTVDYRNDDDAVRQRLQELLGTASAVADEMDLADVRMRLDAYLVASAAVRADAKEREYDKAKVSAVDPLAPASSELDDALTDRISSAAEVLRAKAADARDAVRVLVPVLGVLFALTAVLVLAGFAPRLREYR